MGFKLDLSPAYFAPVTLTMLDANGALQRHVFDAQFNRLDETALEAMQKRMASGQLDDNSLLDEVMCGWRGITDASDKAIDYSSQARRSVCAKAPGMRVALVTAYFASLDPKASAHLSEKN